MTIKIPSNSALRQTMDAKAPTHETQISYFRSIDKNSGSKKMTESSDSSKLSLMVEEMKAGDVVQVTDDSLTENEPEYEAQPVKVNDSQGSKYISDERYSKSPETLYSWQ